jgi:hypothetical protein
MATSPLFGWEEPDDTDLVKDGAAAIRTLGNAIDTSMGDLLGGTTGQVLSKNSNTNMDFTWVTSDDANAIQNTIVDAKGDLISATGSDVPARLAVGSNGETLVADSSTSTGLRYINNFAAGKNAIINGAFNVNQRAFSSTTSSATFTFDRYKTEFSGGTVTYSSQAFTPGAAPVAGYEATNFLQIVTSGQSGANFALIDQKIEDVRTFAGQTVTISFWAKVASGTGKVGVAFEQNFGSGGSGTVVLAAGDLTAITTSWARYTVTAAISSVSGKTIGTSSYLRLCLFTSAGTAVSSYSSIGVVNQTIGFWGVQIEAGSVATAFQTATGTIQGELAACQRYYFRISTTSGAPWFGQGITQTASLAYALVTFQSTMRVRPTTIDYSGTKWWIPSGSGAITPTVQESSPYSTLISISGSSMPTGGSAINLIGTDSTSYLGFSAEL